jgi:hypothetical protein
MDQLIVPGVASFTVHLPDRAEPYVLGAAIQLDDGGRRLWAVINGSGFSDVDGVRRYRATAHGSFPTVIVDG